MPRNIAVVSTERARRYTALYEKIDVGSHESWSFLDTADYDSKWLENDDVGRGLQYLNAYTHAGIVRFSAIWTEEPYGEYEARYGLTERNLEARRTAAARSGLRTRVLTGYDEGGHVRFGALWTAIPR